MQVMWLALGVAAVAYRTDDLATLNRSPGTDGNAIQVCVVMQPPLGSQYQYNITPQALGPHKRHDTAGRRQGGRSQWRKDIDPFVYTGNAPGLVPERQRIPVLAGGVLDRNYALFGQQITEYHYNADNSPNPFSPLAESGEVPQHAD